MVKGQFYSPFCLHIWVFGVNEKTIFFMEKMHEMVGFYLNAVIPRSTYCQVDEALLSIFSVKDI